MKLSYREVVKRPALFSRLTGLRVVEFEKLLESFSAEYDQLVIQPRLQVPNRKRALGGGQKGVLKDPADKLLFILVYTRIYPLLIVQGMFFGIAESKACKWVGILLPILDATRGQSHMRPKRAKGRSLEEIIEEFPELWELGERSGPSAVLKMTRSRKSIILVRRSAIPANMSPSLIPKRNVFWL